MHGEKTSRPPPPLRPAGPRVAPATTVLAALAARVKSSPNWRECSPLNKEVTVACAVGSVTAASSHVPIVMSHLLVFALATGFLATDLSDTTTTGLEALAGSGLGLEASA